MGVAVAAMLVVISGVGQSGCAAVTPTAADGNQAARPQSGSVRAELRIGDLVRVDGLSTTIRFERVTGDSRCPTGVTCVWEGDAVVELRIEPDAGKAATVALHANQQFTHEAALPGFRVRLERLEPYPEPAARSPTTTTGSCC